MSHQRATKQSTSTRAERLRQETISKSLLLSLRTQNVKLAELSPYEKGQDARLAWSYA